MNLDTLSDVRRLFDRHLPPRYRQKPTWRYLAVRLKEAAEGTNTTADVALALRIVLSMEGITCRPR